MPRVEIRNYKAKLGRDSGLKVCTGRGMPRVEIAGLKNPIVDPLHRQRCKQFFPP